MNKKEYNEFMNKLIEGKESIKNVNYQKYLKKEYNLYLKKVKRIR